MGNIINSVKQDLNTEKKVLFSGTPCQVAGILGAIPEKLQFIYNRYTLS